MDRLETHERQFAEDVFPAELAEIRRRRRNAGDERPLADGINAAVPSTKLGLVGLAFSGGGIRSASFCLGVVQHLIKSRLFPRVDYLSTVSGGGFTGSCLSTLMARDPKGAELLVNREGAAEPPALNHIRNGSNYLLPAGLLNELRLPAVIVTGALYTLLLFLPLVMLAVFLTEIFFEVTGSVLPTARNLVPIVGVAPLLLFLIKRPLMMTFRPARASWADRDRDGRRLGLLLLLAGCSLIAVPLLFALDRLVISSPDEIYDLVVNPLFERGNWGVRGWLFWVVLGIAGLIIFAWRHFRPRLLIVGFGVAGPLGLLIFYLTCCLYMINSPVVIGNTADTLASVLGTTCAPPDAADCEREKQSSLRAAVDRVLIAKRYATDEGKAEDYDIGDHASSWIVLHRKEEASLGLLHFLEESWLTTYREPELTIRVATSAREHGLLARSLFSLGLVSEPELGLLIDELAIVPRQLTIVPGRLEEGWTWGHAEWWFYLSGLLLFTFNYFFVNLNGISIHGFYRDRLSRTFLIFRGDTALESADEIKLSDLGGEGSVAPYHLVNTALNLQGSDDPQLRERKTAPFVLAKKYCGGHHGGYCPTDRMEQLDPDLNLGTAMAISGAAAAPNMGAVTVRSLAFVMTMLNIRLNYWLPNPAYGDTWGWRRLAGRPGLRYLLQEALGAPDNRSAYVNCSDGGHIENLGVYELVKRRCRTIICVDGEADPSFSFHGFTRVQRQVEIDFGARIHISTSDMQSIRPDETRLSRSHGAVGTIDYDGGEKGVFIYLKLSCTGNEPQYVEFYRHLHPSFPHESTSDQFFEETQFEVYRALGENAANDLLAAKEVRAAIGEEPLDAPSA